MSDTDMLVKNLTSRVDHLESVIEQIQQNEKNTLEVVHKLDNNLNLVAQKQDSMMFKIDEIKDGMVLKVEFLPVQKWVNTVIYIVVTSVIVSILGLIIVKSQ
jgi:hypothetical protein